MKAYKCDRCKTFYTREDADMYDDDITTEPELRMVWTNPKSNAYYNKVDLCPKCEQEMNNWFNLERVGSNNGYS